MGSQQDRVYTRREAEEYIESFPGDCILYEAAQDGLRVVSWSADVPRTFGFSEEEYLDMRKRGALAGVLPNDREYVEKSINKLLTERCRMDIYFRVVHKTAGFVWLHTKGIWIGTYEENPLIAVEYLNATLETENINSLLNNDKNMLYVCDAETWELLYANRAALDYWGKKDFVGRPCYELIKGRSGPCRSCVMRQIRNGYAHIEEFYDDAMDRWLSVDSYDTLWYGRKAYFQRAADITEARRNRKLLNDDNALIRRIAGTVFEFIGIIDAAGRSISIKNVKRETEQPVSSAHLDYDKACLRFIEAVADSGEREYCRKCASLENITARLEESELYSFAWTQPGEGGDIFRKQITCCWLDEAHKEIIMIKSDITDSYVQEQEQMKLLREAVQTAERANRAKSDFLSRMSHDMRTPLNGILGLAELMEQKEDLEDIRRDLTQLELSGRYLLNLINDTLDVSKIENGLLELHPVVCDGKLVLENTLSLLRPNMRKKNITMNIHADRLPFTKLFVDVARVQQVFTNVIGNAVKFSPEGGTIDFYMDNLSCVDGVLRDRVVVRDYGIGISPDFLPDLFKPFSQEHRCSKSGCEGTGLGMAIARQIVELMGGKISVKSELGKGTEITFTLNLPIATPEQLRGQAHAGGQADLGCLSGKRVLICEDNDLNAEITENMLKLKGMAADRAENGLAGVERFESGGIGEYAAILMDIRMPVMDGLEAAKKIRALDRPDAKTVPIIAMTANAFDEDRENTAAAGMNAHLSKPAGAQTLYEVLAEQISGAETGTG